MKQTRVNKKDQILDVAQQLAMEGGFSAMSIDRVIEVCQITKGGFFYHFKSKDDLARALIERYAKTDLAMLANLMDRAETLSEDPLERMLIFLKLFSESVATMDTSAAGCLFATYSYEIAHLPADLKDFIRNTFTDLRMMLLARLEAVAEKYPPADNVSMLDLANLFIVVVEGGLVTARFFEDRQLFSRQIEQYRQYLKLVFPR